MLNNTTLVDIQNYKCSHRTTTACGDYTFGFQCEDSAYLTIPSYYHCSLNIDIQNETSYSCNRCFNSTLSIYRNNSLCDVDFKLNILSVAFESALKDLWLSLPVLPFCHWDQLTCFHNYIDRNYSESNSSELLHCKWRFKNDSLQSTTRIEYDWSFLFVIIFIIAGGVGNILVCLAVCLDKRLQNVTNYFLLSLAIADLLVSLFVMPMGAIPGFLGHWPLGVVWCNVYVTCDVLACSASIMHMCFISIGRYVGIRNPLKSRHHSTKRVVIIKIALVWLLSMTVSSSITILGLINNKNIMPNQRICVINNRLFWIFGSLVAFYIPMLTMVVSFALTVHLLKRQAKMVAAPVTGATQRRLRGYNTGQNIRRIGARSSPNLSTSRSVSRQTIWRLSGASRHESKTMGVSVSHPELSYLNGAKTIRSKRARNVSTQTPPNIGVETRKARTRPPKLIHAPNPLTLRFLPYRKKDRAMSANAVANEQKATKVLGLVFFTFVLCWAPFFLLNILFASCPSCSVPDHVVDVCLWLGYVSSTINPIIYTIFNRTFRAAFLRLLCCQCSRRGRCTLYRSAAGSARSASQLCAQSALPLAISLRPPNLDEVRVPDSIETIMMEPTLPNDRHY
ncbi:5-hydroxytryptamine receptor 2C [Leguminivora glycinivorella]|uniref:5-hydroxytryptamine receptor 2C n=1 Tax=Leguminivora glycinivorella TaxID=1035111 RepID=UPI00200CA39C|nr:5-hydroxytryptamine receptor 2C [Leguminivora glycinivorella]